MNDDVRSEVRLVHYSDFVIPLPFCHSNFVIQASKRGGDAGERRFAAHALTSSPATAEFDPPAIPLLPRFRALSAFEPTHTIMVEQTWRSVRSDVNGPPTVERDGFGVIYFEARPAH